VIQKCFWPIRHHHAVVRTARPIMGPIHRTASWRDQIGLMVGRGDGQIQEERNCIEIDNLFCSYHHAME